MVNVKQEVKLREAATKKYLAAQKSQNMKKEMKNIPEIEENLADMMADMMAERRMEEDMIADMMAEEEEDNRRLEEDNKLIEERLQRMCLEQNHDMMSTENHVTEMEDKIEDIMMKMKTTEDSVMQMEEEMDQLNQLIREEEDWAQELLRAEHTNEHMKEHIKTTQDALENQRLCAAHNNEHMKQHIQITEDALAEQLRCVEHMVPLLLAQKRHRAEPTEALEEQLPCTEHTNEHMNNHMTPTQEPLSAEHTRTTQYNRAPKTEDDMTMNVKKLVREREASKEQLLSMKTPEDNGDRNSDLTEMGPKWDRRVQGVTVQENVYKMTPEDRLLRMEEEMKRMVNVRKLIRQREAMTEHTDQNIKYDINEIESDSDENIQDMEYIHDVHQPEDNVQDMEYDYYDHQPEENLQDMGYNYIVHQPEDNIQDINPKHPYSGEKRKEEQREEEETKKPENKVVDMSAEVEDIVDRMKTTQPTALTNEKKLEYVKDRRTEDRKKRHQMIPAWQNDDKTRMTDSRGEDMTPMVNVKQMIRKREAAWQQVLAAEQKHKEMLKLLRRTEYKWGVQRLRSPMWGERQSPMSMEEDGDMVRPMTSPVEEKCNKMEEDMATTMGHVQELLKEEEAMKQEIDTAEQKIKDLKDEMKATERNVLIMEEHITEIKVERKDEVSKWDEERHRLHVGEEENLVDIGGKKENESDDDEDEDEEEETPANDKVVRIESPTPQLSMGSVVGLFREERAVTEQILSAEEKIRHLKEEMKATEVNVVQMETTIANIKQERKDEEDKWEEERLQLQELEEERVEERKKWEEEGAARQTEAGSQVLSINQMEAIFSHYCPLTLDPNTANKRLFLSENNTMATHVKEKQPYLDHPDRFDYWSQVLCREDLTGRCYWEIEWRKQVSIAVAYRRIRRQGLSDDCLFGHNANSWSLEGYDVPTSLYGLQGARYIVRHDRKKTQLPICPSGSNRVGVYLDYHAGNLSFYSVSSGTRTHLYTFQTKFTEPLYAAFWCWFDESSVALCPKEDLKFK